MSKYYSYPNGIVVKVIISLFTSYILVLLIINVIEGFTVLKYIAFCAGTC